MLTMEEFSRSRQIVVFECLPYLGISIFQKANREAHRSDYDACFSLVLGSLVVKCLPTLSLVQLCMGSMYKVIRPQPLT